MLQNEDNGHLDRRILADVILARSLTGGGELRTGEISKIHIKSSFDPMKSPTPESKRSRTSGNLKNDKTFLNVF